MEICVIVDMERSISPAQQKALIMDSTDSSFLSSLRFIELSPAGLSVFTRELRLSIVRQLRQYAIGNNCTKLIREIPEYNPVAYPDSDAYVMLFCSNYGTNTNINRVQLIKHFVAIDITTPELGAGVGVVGYISATYLPGAESIFRYTHSVHPLHAAVGYIRWTCSFTNSNPELSHALAQKLRASPGKKLSIGSYLLVNLMRHFIHTISAISSESGIPVHMYMFWSFALMSARSAHRKVGKRSACGFLTSWESIAEPLSGIDTMFSEGYSANNMIFTYPPLVPGEPIYDTVFAVTGANLNQKLSATASNTNNNAYTCPSGLRIKGNSNKNQNSTHNMRNKMTNGGARLTRRSAKSLRHRRAERHVEGRRN